jgi:amidase
VEGQANQDFLIAAQEQKLGPNEYREHFDNMRKLSREEGIDFILQKYDLYVIIGPADNFIFPSLPAVVCKPQPFPEQNSSTYSISGYPVAAMPLSYLNPNGRPLGMAAIAGEHQDALLVKVLSAWEATFLPEYRHP